MANEVKALNWNEQKKWTKKLKQQSEVNKVKKVKSKKDKRKSGRKSKKMNNFSKSSYHQTNKIRNKYGKKIVTIATSFFLIFLKSLRL